MAVCRAVARGPSSQPARGRLLDASRVHATLGAGLHAHALGHIVRGALQEKLLHVVGTTTQRVRLDRLEVDVDLVPEVRLRREHVPPDEDEEEALPH
eukprot:9416906-Pyramimonas_sp.AAC.1